MCEKQAEKLKDVKSTHTPDISNDIFSVFVRHQYITEFSHKYNIYLPCYLVFFPFLRSFLPVIGPTSSPKERAFETVARI